MSTLILGLFMTSAHSNRIDTHGASIHFSVVGTGAPILLVQGVGLDGRGFAPQVEALSKTYTCVCIDNRGIGGSRVLDSATISVPNMADDVLAVADALGFERFHLVGHSLGGVVAQRVALNAPTRVLSLVLQCTFAGGRDLASPSMRLIWLGLLSKLGTVDMRRAAFARLVSPPALVTRDRIQTTIEALELAFGRSLAQAPNIASLQLAALRKHDERERLPELSAIPCLVQSGTFDPIARPEFGRELATRIGTACFEEWPEASHALPIQDRDKVNARMLEHFTSSTHTGR